MRNVKNLKCVEVQTKQCHTDTYAAVKDLQPKRLARPAAVPIAPSDMDVPIKESPGSAAVRGPGVIVADQAAAASGD